MTMTKKTAEAADNHQGSGRKFPAEAYEYNDDVTAEAVEKVRERAREILAGGEWEVIDGLGRASS